MSGSRWGRHRETIAELEGANTRISSAAKTNKELQQQVQALEQALYVKEQLKLSWADQGDLADALVKVEQLEFQLKVAAGKGNTARSMARALQTELGFWRSQWSMQHKHRNGTQRGGSSNGMWRSW